VGEGGPCEDQLQAPNHVSVVRGGLLESRVVICRMLSHNIELEMVSTGYRPPSCCHSEHQAKVGREKRRLVHCVEIGQLIKSYLKFTVSALISHPPKLS
jgi:hypothetical protein